MSNIYRYQIKDKQNREKIILKDVAHAKSIEDALAELFNTDLDNYRIENHFFEFRLKREASQPELQNLGKRIAAKDAEFGSIKKIYNNSTQVFSRMPNRYYAYLEKVIKPSDGQYLFLFDSVYYGDLSFLDQEEPLSSNIPIYDQKAEFLRNLNSFTVEADISRQETGMYLSASLAKQLDENGTLPLCEWYSYEKKEDGVTAFSYAFRMEPKIESPGGEDTLKIGKIKSIPKGHLVDNLKKYFSLEDLDVTDREYRLLRSILAVECTEVEKKAAFVAVYNVGQALCCALCDSNGCPIIYFDFGAPYGQNAKTYPENLEFCFNNNPPIILSHWDKDHWYGARKHDMAQEQKWVVPNQKVGIQATQFAYLLHEKGNLIIWDDKLTDVPTNYGAVFKCAGLDSDIHNNGIGLIATVTNENGESKQYLLPGDNNYEYINSSSISGLLPQNDGMVATHHGGEYGEKLPMKNSDIPQNRKSGKIVYSYGDGNSHGHPTYTMDHSTRGWSISLETKTGDCALGLTNAKVSSTCPVCKGKTYHL